MTLVKKTIRISLLLLLLFTSSMLLLAQDSLRALKVGADYAYYPYEFVNEIHEADGFDIDIIKAIGKELNRELDIQPGNWFNVKKDIEDGKLDLVAGMYYLPDRAEKVSFSMPYIIITHSIFVKEGDYWQSLKDVKDQPNLKVVVENSSLLHKYLTTAGIASNRILPVENQLDALKILSETPNTCALLPDLQGKYIAFKNGYDNIITVGLPILPREYSIAVNKRDTLLLSRINDALTIINQNGTYEKIYNKWFGQYDEKSQGLIKLNKLEILFVLLLIIAIIVFLSLYINLKKVLRRNAEQLNRELHEKEKLNSELTKNETILRKITENTPYPIAMINAEGFFIYVNRKFEDEFGYTRKDVYNLEQWINLFFPDEEYQKSVKANLEKRILLITENQGHKANFLEIFTVTNKNKEEIVINIQIVSLGDGQLLFFFENITERKQNENKLTDAKKKAESADKMKSTFLANISHEIRTPMNAILGFSSLLSEDEIEKDDKDIYTKLIKKNGTILMVLIQDIIDISKIEAGELTIVPQITDIHEIILDTFETIMEDFNLKIPDPIRFELKLPSNIEHTKYFVRVDVARLSQVLINVLTNSFKYTDKGLVEFGFYTLENNKIRVYIKDTGIGIKKEEQLFIFNRFTRSDDEMAVVRGGTGLGLAIAYQILKLFGSELFVDSKEGNGSTFYFDLNYYEGFGEKVDNKLHTYPQKTAVDYNWQGKNILIIEDNHENANYLMAALKKTKCNLLLEENGADAVETIIANKDIDLVVLDWILPEVSGREITQIIKRERASIPIIVVTAMAMVEDRISITNEKVDAYFAKPIDKNELLEKINQLLSSVHE